MTGRLAAIRSHDRPSAPKCTYDLDWKLPWLGPWMHFGCSAPILIYGCLQYSMVTWPQLIVFLLVLRCLFLVSCKKNLLQIMGSLNGYHICLITAMFTLWLLCSLNNCSKKCKIGVVTWVPQNTTVMTGWKFQAHNSRS